MTQELHKCVDSIDLCNFEPYLDNFKELCFINAPAPVLIVHLECPFELVFQFAPQDEVQRRYVFQKINGIVLDVVLRQKGRIISLGRILFCFLAFKGQICEATFR